MKKDYGQPWDRVERILRQTHDVSKDDRVMILGSQGCSHKYIEECKIALSRMLVEGRLK